MSSTSNPTCSNSFRKLAGVKVVSHAHEPTEGAVIAVKPGDVPAAAAAAGEVGAGRVLSVAAGVTTSAVETALGPGAAVVRAMPNTPALVGAGAAAIAAGRHASDAGP